MNIHPLIVHFPIAFFTVYALAEILRIKFLTKQNYWFYFKAIVLFIGLAGSGVAFLTGDTAKNLFEGQRNIIDLHEFWAQTTIVIFSVLAGAYFIAWLEKVNFRSKLPKALTSLWNLLVMIEQFILSAPIAILLAVFGLIAVTITGALGGSLVYGQNFDPIVKLIYSWYGLNQ